VTEPDELVVRRVRLSEADVVLFGAILNGEDHLASIQGERARADAEGRVVVAVLTTGSRAHELDAWLDELGPVLGLERLDELTVRRDRAPSG
jgi:hypothetical protein